MPVLWQKSCERAPLLPGLILLYFYGHLFIGRVRLRGLKIAETVQCLVGLLWGEVIELKSESQVLISFSSLMCSILEVLFMRAQLISGQFWAEEGCAVEELQAVARGAQQRRGTQQRRGAHQRRGAQRRRGAE